MRDRDRAQAAAALDEGRDVIEQRHAVPENVAARRLDEERALPDPELRLEPDAGQPRLFLADLRPVRSPHVVVRHPLLALLRHVLPLVAADRARGRRLARRRELRPARLAQERRDQSLPSTVTDISPASPSPSGQSCSTRPAASRIAPASTSRRVSAMPSACHSHTKASGPGGGNGQSHMFMSHLRAPPPPPWGISRGPFGGSSGPRRHISWSAVAFLPSAN